MNTQQPQGFYPLVLVTNANRQNGDATMFQCVFCGEPSCYALCATCELAAGAPEFTLIRCTGCLRYGASVSDEPLCQDCQDKADEQWCLDDGY